MPNGGDLIRAITTRLPGYLDPATVALRARPVGELPVDRERAERVVRYVSDIARLAESTLTIADDDQGSDIAQYDAALVGIAAMARRTCGLVDAALYALDYGATFGHRSEDVTEEVRWRRRLEGKPEEDEQPAEAAQP
jgi:hypothetical protein